MKIVVLLSILFSTCSFAFRGEISLEEAKRVNLKALQGEFIHKKGFGIVISLTPTNPRPAQPDLFKPYPGTGYEVEITLNEKAEYYAYDRVFLVTGSPYVSVDAKCNILMSIRKLCDDPQCTKYSNNITFTLNKGKTKYSVVVETEMSNDSEQGIEEEGLEENPIEYCEMFYSNIYYATNIVEYDGRTCDANATYYLNKK